MTELQEMAQLIMDMDKYLRNNVADEEIFERWLYTVPDELTIEDATAIADESESFHDVLRLFAEIVVESDQ